jgi:hypothetical protein
MTQRKRMPLRHFGGTSWGAALRLFMGLEVGIWRIDEGLKKLTATSMPNEALLEEILEKATWTRFAPDGTQPGIRTVGRP